MSTQQNLCSCVCVCANLISPRPLKRCSLFQSFSRFSGAHWSSASLLPAFRATEFVIDIVATHTQFSVSQSFMRLFFVSTFLFWKKTHFLLCYSHINWHTKCSRRIFQLKLLFSVRHFCCCLHCLWCSIHLESFHICYALMIRWHFAFYFLMRIPSHKIILPKKTQNAQSTGARSRTLNISNKTENESLDRELRITMFSWQWNVALFLSVLSHSSAWFILLHTVFIYSFQLAITLFMARLNAMIENYFHRAP